MRSSSFPSAGAGAQSTRWGPQAQAWWRQNGGHAQPPAASTTPQLPTPSLSLTWTKWWQGIKIEIRPWRLQSCRHFEWWKLYGMHVVLTLCQTEIKNHHVHIFSDFFGTFHGFQRNRRCACFHTPSRLQIEVGFSECLGQGVCGARNTPKICWSLLN